MCGGRRTNIKNGSRRYARKRASCKLRNTLLGYIKKQQIVEFMLLVLHSKNALEMISEDPNIPKNSGGACPQTGPMLIIRE